MAHLFESDVKWERGGGEADEVVKSNGVNNLDMNAEKRTAG